MPTSEEALALAAPYTGFFRPGLPGVPLHRMHCTLLHTVGLPFEGIDLDALLDDVEVWAREVQPFTLTFDRPAIGNVAVELSGWPGGPFTGIVEAVTQSMVRTGAEFTSAPSRYPHMSLAYTSEGSDSIESGSLKAALAALDGPLSGTVLADRLHLVEQWHDGTQILWEPIAEVPLGAAA
ncbi:2'-5' RNA ligase family protein [Streptomyces sp. NPDC056883]|uniref:2'-5' RNA ligase family protein n=1 Tax=Streptomyces sp. NPDC056883 TaxID=3345959 RepID=UPI003693A89A